MGLFGLLTEDPDVGQHLTYLARRISEWSPEATDPAPLLLIPALLIQHNKANSRVSSPRTIQT